MLTAVTGINWGDEGKGRVVDLLAEQADIVVRYQGGNNAGHTVVNAQGKFVLLGNSSSKSCMCFRRRNGCRSQSSVFRNFTDRSPEHICITEKS